ncbi:hypothetical protein D3OALGA1CA_4811 [Olavius algarvensis associated proteobacterium Delta 3]|nr:hypothetical protein D3OALGB2SA_2087 [Olavius algarvensis associated proteobacterium Delta 3]CAB5157219.1 hypothetical protein D3OALGA1CA_4811 [Olavius algarvensis associated proteobacterium Delta 3]
MTESPPVDVTCKCGNVVQIEKERTWCTKCGHVVYVDPKQQRRHKLNIWYLSVMFIGTVFFLVYVYLELIIRYTFIGD